jgi:hypothetical protein
MTDMFGLPIKVGDTILCCTNSENHVGTVAKIITIEGKETAVLSLGSVIHYSHYIPKKLISLEPYKLLHPELFI